MAKTTERHGEAPLKYDVFSGYAGGLFFCMSAKADSFL